jgi:hypothetical protein
MSDLIVLIGWLVSDVSDTIADTFARDMVAVSAEAPVAARGALLLMSGSGDRAIVIGLARSLPVTGAADSTDPAGRVVVGLGSSPSLERLVRVAMRPAGCTTASPARKPSVDAGCPPGSSTCGAAAGATNTNPVAAGGVASSPARLTMCATGAT